MTEYSAEVEGKVQKQVNRGRGEVWSRKLKLTTVKRAPQLEATWSTAAADSAESEQNRELNTVRRRCCTVTLVKEELNMI